MRADLPSTLIALPLRSTMEKEVVLGVERICINDQVILACVTLFLDVFAPGSLFTVHASLPPTSIATPLHFRC